GVYRLIVTNLSGCIDTALIAVGFNPKPGIGRDTLISICQGNSFNLATLYNTQGLTTAWTINGSLVSTAASVNTAGSYQLIGVNSFGCSDTVLADLTVNVQPAIGNDTSISRCYGYPINLNMIYSTSGLSGNWLFNNLPVTNTSSVSIPGNYELIASTTAGCKDTAQLVFKINPTPALGNDSSIGICIGKTTNLTNIYSTIGLSSKWTTGGIIVANPAAVSAGIYQLIASNNFGCSDTATVTNIFNPKPDLGNDKSISICPGSATNLGSQFVTTGLVAQWTSNGTVVSNPTAIISAGIYQLIVSNSLGCLDTALVTVSVNPKPNIGSDKTVTVCSGTTIDLTRQFVTTGLSTAWTLRGVVVTNPAVVIFSGLYQLKVTDSNGCTDTAQFNAIISPAPILGSDKMVPACAGVSVDLTKEYVTTGLTASWTKGGIAVTNPATVTIAGAYQLIVTNTSACADTAIATVIINTNPTVKTGNPTAACIPSTIDLTASGVTNGSTPGLSYTYWQNISAITPYQNPQNAVDGVYYIKGTDGNGCFDIKAVTATVYQMPVVNAGNDTTICNQSFAILRGSANNLSVGMVSYLWSPATGLSRADTSTIIVRPAATITYTIKATVNYGPCILSATDNIRVNVQPPVPAFAGNDTIAISGIPFQLRASGGAGYLWFPTGPLNNPSIPNPLAVLQQDTRFTVRVTDFAGCVAMDTVTIKIYNGITYYLPNAFSPNGDGLNDIFRPVPAGIVSTDWFRIYSRYGELVFETTKWLDGWDGNFRGKKQPIGNYIWAIKGKGRDGNVIQMKGNVLLVR
ncbi:MAG: T9SS type B sorting domain-containing protein, partial [Ferruginibacter sp.]